MPDAGLLIGYVANGLVYGSILALGAIGLTLVYGILRISNFAHGDLITLGAFAALFFTVERAPQLPLLAIVTGLGLGALGGIGLLRGWLRRGESLVLGLAALASAAGGLWLSFLWSPEDRTTDAALIVGTLLAVVASIVLALGLEVVLWRPLRRRGGTVLTFLILSIGIALVLRNILQLHFGGGNRYFERPTAVSDIVLGARLSQAQQFALVTSVLLLVALHLFLRSTRTGKAMRALADNPELARVSGIHVDRITLYVWGIAAAFTAIAGVLLTLVLNNNMQVNMGFNLLLPLFAAVILGGIGSAYGAILGAFLIGLAMKTTALWWTSEYELATAFLVLLGVLLVRPRGILGGRL